VNKKTEYLIKNGALVVALALLPGCKLLDYFGKKQVEKKSTEKAKDIAKPKTVALGTGAVLCKIDGKPAIMESDYLKSMKQMLQANPYFRGAGIESLPVTVKRKFFDELVKQELIIVDANRKKLSDNPEFIKAYQDMMKLVERSLKVQFFEKKIYDGIRVSSGDVEKHYKENKSKYVKTAGGVLTSGARFSSEMEANKFFAKAKKTPKDFDKLAKEEKSAFFRSFGRVTGDTEDKLNVKRIPAPVKEKILALKKFPAVEKIKVGSDIWVVGAFEKKDTVFFDVKEIRPQIEGVIKNNQFRQVLDDRIKELRTRTTIDVNEDYFKEKPKVDTQKVAQRMTEDQILQKALKERPAQVKKKHATAA